MAATSFHQQIAANRRNSFLLAGLVVVLLGALGFTAGWALFGDPAGGLLATGLALTFGVLVGIGTYFAGDSFVLAVSQAKEVDETSAPQLMNVVRELAIAANVPMPKVYLIDDTAPNAFATGRDPKHASVAITTGPAPEARPRGAPGRHRARAVARPEPRHPVRAHRRGHGRGHRHPRRLLPALHLLERRRWPPRPRLGRGQQRRRIQVVIFIVAIALAILAPIISRFIQLAVNRQREYLADASSVELTRNPYGLERALAKISGDQEVLEVANRGTQHMYFTNPIKKFEERSSGLMSTHPAIIDRINRLRELTGDPPLGSAETASLAGLE